MTEKQMLAQLKTTMDLLENNFSDLYELAGTEDKDILRLRLAAARDAYWAAIGGGLADSNRFIEELADDLAAKNKAMSAEINRLQDIKAVLEIATEAIKLGASIATLAAA